MFNNYWQICQGEQILDNVHTYSDENIWKLICEDEEMTSPDKLQIFNDDPYSYIYKQDVKKLLLKYYPKFADLTSIDLSKEDVIINLLTKSDYRKFNEDFDYEMSFLDYINSEQASKDRNTDISDVLLMDNGFIRRDDGKSIQDYYKKFYGVKEYSAWYRWTGDIDKHFNQIKIDIDKQPTNSGSLWYIHIDNCDCCTILTAEINTVLQFNILMQNCNSKFKLKNG